MAFITLEDRYGELECIVFSQPYAKYMHLLRTDNAIFIEGYVSHKDDEAPRIVASTIEELTDNDRYQPPRTTEVTKAAPVTQQAISNQKKLYLRVPNMECREYKKALNIVDIFEGTAKVIFYDMSLKKYVAYSRGIDATQKVINEMNNILGKDNVVLK